MLDLFNVVLAAVKAAQLRILMINANIVTSQPVVFWRSVEDLPWVILGSSWPGKLHRGSLQTGMP